MPEPAVLQDPEAGARLKRGFDTLADLLALTLGPTQGIVLSEPATGSQPEVLSDAATIARRVTELPHRTEDVGAMLLRNLVWRMHGRAGDGTATAAVLAQSILGHAHRYKAAGANPMLLRSGIDQAALAALDALGQMARPVEDEEDLTSVAQTITAEPDLSLLLGEMYDLLGPDAFIDIEEFVAPYLEREYKEGGRWAGRLASPYLITEPPTRRALLSSCQVALYAGELADVDDVQPLLALVAGTELKRLVLLAHEIKGSALSTLVMNHQKDHVRVVAATLSRSASKRRTDFEDLAVLTGARVLSPETGSSLCHIQAGDLGTARRIEAGTDEVVVVGDERRATAIREQIATLRARLQAQPEGDDGHEQIRFRLARLSGQVATLKIGASTKVEREAMLHKARKALRALPLALREGVVPGGGVAYLDCLPAVRGVRAQVEGEAAWGVEILAGALEAPFRQLLRNAGASSPGVILDEVQRRGRGFGYDVLSGQIVHMEEAGLMDAAGVLGEALRTAVSGAVMALTTEAIVHNRQPETSLAP
jgi:chaperonin GroEL